MPELCITNLPDDVLDAIFMYLLPEVNEDVQSYSASTRRCPRITPPHTLLSCRLVCRLFYRIASPWTWRNAELFIDANYPVSDTIPGAAEFERLAIHRGLQKAQFLASSPELFSKIRLLHVSEWVMSAGPMLGDFTVSLVHCFEAMHNLQEIMIGPFHGDCARPLAALLRQPRLHTVSLCAMPEVSELHFDTPLNHIKKLNIQDCPALTGIISCMPHLESLTLREWSTPELPQAPVVIPWKTLRELSITGKTLWERVLCTSEAAGVAASLPLESFHINAYMLHSQDLCRLFELMDGQRLRDLSLKKVYGVELPLLETIANSFPHLHQLRIISPGRLQRWTPGFNACLAVLRRLKELGSLDWNCVEQPTAEFDRSTYEPLVPLISTELPSLQDVRWTDLSHGNYEVFKIIRHVGHYASHVTAAVSKREADTPSLVSRLASHLSLLFGFFPSLKTRFS